MPSAATSHEHSKAVVRATHVAFGVINPQDALKLACYGPVLDTSLRATLQSPPTRKEKMMLDKAAMVATPIRSTPPTG
jgi:hypothetical protein